MIIAWSYAGVATGLLMMVKLKLLNKYITPKEVSKLTHMSLKWVYRHARQLGGDEFTET